MKNYEDGWYVDNNKNIYKIVDSKVFQLKFHAKNMPILQLFRDSIPSLISLDKTFYKI